MAPRPLETVEQFATRFRQAARDGQSEVRFGGHHFTHAIVLEDGTWCVRRLVLDPVRAEAFRREHGYFMPETAEMLSEPGGDILLRGTVDEVLSRLPELWDRR